MKDDTRKGIEVAANVAIIITALLLCAVLVKKYTLPRSVPSDAPDEANTFTGGAIRSPSDTQLQPRMKISLGGIDWAKNGQTLLLAISSKCHYCSESAAFYQRLAKERERTRLVAVLPESEGEGESYLAKLDVPVDAIKQASFASLGVSSVPMLILVNSDGVVVKSWSGKLASNLEAEVVAGLRRRNL